MAENLLTRPTLSGVMRESLDYTNMGIGLTDRLFLLGHADGLPLNDPYQVLSVREALRAMGGDPDAPLVRSLLEAYYAGARDIWLVPVARLDEYIPNYEDRFEAISAVPNYYGDYYVGYAAQETFYQRYYEQLATAYDLLKGFELPQLIVPLHAPLYDAGDFDFVTQLANHCFNSFEITKTIRIGVVGTAVRTMSPEVINEMANDSRWDNYGPEGKFVLPVVGSGLFNIQETIISHEGSPVATVAATIAQSPLNRGMTNQRLNQMITTNFPDFTKQQLETLCNAKLNPLVRSTASKRGRAFDVRLLTDNMLATNGSDFWSLGQVRLVQQVIDNVRRIGRRHLGTVGFAEFRRALDEYFLDLSLTNTIRNFNLVVNREPNIDTNRFSETIIVDIAVQPYFGVRTLSFQAEVGPGA